MLKYPSSLFFDFPNAWTLHYTSFHPTGRHFWSGGRNIDLHPYITWVFQLHSRCLSQDFPSSYFKEKTIMYWKLLGSVIITPSELVCHFKVKVLTDFYLSSLSIPLPQLDTLSSSHFLSSFSWLASINFLKLETMLFGLYQNQAVSVYCKQNAYLLQLLNNIFFWYNDDCSFKIRKIRLNNKGSKTSPCFNSYRKTLLSKLCWVSNYPSTRLDIFLLEPLHYYNT